MSEILIMNIFIVYFLGNIIVFDLWERKVSQQRAGLV